VIDLSNYDLQTTLFALLLAGFIAWYFVKRVGW